MCYTSKSPVKAFPDCTNKLLSRQSNTSTGLILIYCCVKVVTVTKDILRQDRAVPLKGEDRFPLNGTGSAAHFFFTDAESSR